MYPSGMADIIVFVYFGNCDFIESLFHVPEQKPLLICYSGMADVLFICWVIQISGVCSPFYMLGNMSHIPGEMDDLLLSTTCGYYDLVKSPSYMSGGRACHAACSNWRHMQETLPSQLLAPSSGYLVLNDVHNRRRCRRWMESDGHHHHHQGIYTL